MNRLRGPRRVGGERKWAWPGTRTWLRGLLGAATWAAVCLILLGYNLFPGRVSLRLGEISPLQVRAPRTAQYVDAEETRALLREAEDQVPRQYVLMPYAREDAEKRADSLIDLLHPAPGAEVQTAARLQSAKGIPANSLTWLSQASPADIESLRQRAHAILRTVMGREIRAGTPDVGAAADEAATMAGRPRLDPGEVALLATLVRRAVGPTHLYDEQATRAARAEAKARVADVVRTISADHRIIAAGERVTATHLAMLHAVGLAGPRVGFRRAVALALIAGLLLLLLGAHARLWAGHVYRSLKLLSLLSLLLVLALLTSSLLTLALPSVVMLIVPTVTLMAAVLLGPAIGLALAVVLALLAGLSPDGGIFATFSSLCSSLVALIYVSHLWPVSRLRWVVLALAAANVVVLAGVALLQGQSEGLVKQLALGAGLYGPGAVALALGGIFLLQRPFGITTHLGLLELSNPQHPVLRRLQTEAPGTYYASVIVANLADAAAEAVGADSLLARVGALYHDIGKLSRPAFFVENQALLGTDNVHDSLSSSLSGLIIRSHVKDGVELAQRERLPQEVVEIIGQHHGSTLVSFFYHRALAGERPESVSEDQFRYPGPLPRRKEAALVMLADSVQAAVKSLVDPSPPRVQQMVRDIVRERVVDGQLAACDLTFRDLVAAEITMSRLLTALVCHGRIEYPERAVAGSGA